MDIDGNRYKTVTIGDQTWMTSNLKVVHFNDGEPIHDGNDEYWWADHDSLVPKVAKFAKIINIKSGHYNDFSEVGYHYTWYVVETGKVCPVGWKVPSISDYNHLLDLVNYDMELLLIPNEINTDDAIDHVFNNLSYLSFYPNSAIVIDRQFTFHNESKVWTSDTFDYKDYAKTFTVRSKYYSYEQVIKGFGLPIRCIKK